MPKRSLAAIPILLTCALISPAIADDYMAGAIRVGHLWARATPPGVTVGSGYMSIANTGAEPDRLLSGSVDIAATTAFHETASKNGMMLMRPFPQGIVIKPGEAMVFKPGGYHMMLNNLKQPLLQGQSFQGSLIFEKAGKIAVQFDVESMGSTVPSENVETHDMKGMSMPHH